MTRKLFYIFLLSLTPLFACAQNGVDRMLDEFSSVGSARYTSAVKRNEATHQVEKVVKKLECSGSSTKRLINVFRAEAKKHDAITKQANGEITIIFTTKDKKTNRIYMIKYDADTSYPEVEITIIIRMK